MSNLFKIDDDTPYSHHSRNGTEFKALRCDFVGGVNVFRAPDNLARYSQDLAEMIANHAMFIWPELNGFQGYDCTRYLFNPPQPKNDDDK